jgi:glycosyltransferase involved in cell wall biosynthesis
MKNIAIVMDITEESGGKLHMAISICDHLKKIKGYKFFYITTFSKSKKILDNKLNINTLLFEKNTFINRFLNRLKKTFYFLPFKFPFEKFLSKQNIDLIYFLDPSPLIQSFKNIKFIYTIFDIEHRELTNFPEFKKKTFHNRDDDYLLAGKNCSKLIVGTKKIKEQISNIYKINKDKIIDIKFPPSFTKINNIEFSKIQRNIYETGKNKNYLIYPAQFWHHKNHIYLINAVNNIKEFNKFNLKIVFTGYDKGNLSNIKNHIKKNNLEDIFIIFNYVTDDELFYLYQNCSGVIIPTLVAPHTFPLYEAFFFKKPVIYNEKILDDELKSKVIGLDISDIGHLEKTLKKINDKIFVDNLVNKNFIYYEETFNIEKKNNLLKKIFDDILYEK